MLQPTPRPDPDPVPGSDPWLCAEVDWRIARLRDLCDETRELLEKAHVLQSQMDELRVEIEVDHQQRLRSRMPPAD